MRIQVTRSGGVAGISRTGAVEFRLRSDGPDAEWAALYRAARDEGEQLSSEDGAAPAGGLGGAPSRARDAFQWTLRLGSRRLEIPDSYLSGALRELAEKVLAEGQG
ncbi:protealysin inhibitor emfourin [Sinomonas mesophila]|uniref:protealysin inhibitor emfourin n=1 Tax=Sinomonas mesophila TaxID=1531955 RepID=UPI000985E7C5|nr:protealysin inhibitor emfourin [Sinomonas mesophila]